MKAPNYKENPASPADHILAFITGFIFGFMVAFIFYKVIFPAVTGGIIIGAVNILLSGQSARRRRILKLRMQFFDLLEALSVAMRAGNPMLGSLVSARNDLALLYPAGSDILTELDLIIGKFNNAVPLSESFSDLAERSGLEDIAGFATIYKTIEGKSGKANEIVRETQQIIADKMEIEMEIDTMMTAAKTEVNIMLMMPLVILGIVSYTGAGFIDAIYTTTTGRIVSTGGLIIFAVSYALSKKFSNIKL